MKPRKTEEGECGGMMINVSSLCFFWVPEFHINSPLSLASKKKDGPEGISPLGAVKPGDVLLSHNL